MRTDTPVIASPVYFYGISAQLKALVDRLHTPMRNAFSIGRLGLILVGAATLPDLFDPIVMQYQIVAAAATKPSSPVLIFAFCKISLMNHG